MIAYVLFVLAGAFMVAMLANVNNVDLAVPLFGAAFVAGGAGFVLFMVNLRRGPGGPVGPHADSGVAAEKRWLASLPFAVAGYFEVLGAEPEDYCALKITVVWNGDPPPDASTLQAMFYRVDVDARVKSHDARTLAVKSGTISGMTNEWVNNVRVATNKGIVTYVHGLVEQVLLPLHGACPIKRVSMARA